MLYIITSHGRFHRVKLNVIDHYMTATPSSNRKSRDNYHHGDLREALIEAAFNVVEEAGAEAVNFSALAKALGVSQAAPYRHYADRDALLTEVATLAFLRFNEEFRKKLKRRSTRSKLGQLAHIYLDFGLKHVGVYRLLYVSRLVHNAAVGSELYSAADAGFDLILETIDPMLEDLTRRRIALRFWTSLHGVVMLAEQGLIPPKIRQISVVELVDKLVEDTERAIKAAAT